jgi:hypothetical protein
MKYNYNISFFVILILVCISKIKTVDLNSLNPGIDFSNHIDMLSNRISNPNEKKLTTKISYEFSLKNYTDFYEVIEHNTRVNIPSYSCNGNVYQKITYQLKPGYKHKSVMNKLSLSSHSKYHTSINAYFDQDE